MHAATLRQKQQGGTDIECWARRTGDELDIIPKTWGLEMDTKKIRDLRYTESSKMKGLNTILTAALVRLVRP